ncbi:putative acetyl-coa synthetase (adp-forming) [hydrocarbon metagenome]|uniref:Putative acetyl-coa synthetase (Adp-forming) n=1 Tax=hydrocarbon metagenome TaxID=938273 RepID=A0A0W8FNM4_9ZZZZ
MIKDQNIKYLFEPRSIAIIGASNDKGKIGNAVISNIIKSGYQNKIVPINPKGGEIEGIKAYKNILDVTEEIDTACITIPAKFVLESIKECATKGVKYAMVITSGFSEIGKIEEERKLIEAAHEKGMRILGPNVFGLFTAEVSLNATFAGSVIPSGNLGIITQSGALGLSMIGQATVGNVGLSTIVSVGNKADVDEGDLLEYLITQDRTKVILIYMEGVRDGERLVETLKRATKIKPVVIIKAGRSTRGAMAAASHTGSLAGSDTVFDDIIKQCGVLRAENMTQAFEWSKFLAHNPPPAGDNTVIITNGGGAGVMATDACEKYNVKLYDDLQHLKTIFSPSAPEFGSTKNPIDITGQAKAEDYTKAFNAALHDSEIHSVIGVFCETSLFTDENLNVAVEQNYSQFKAAGKPIVFGLLGGETIDDYTRKARRKNIPVYEDIYEGVEVLGAMYSYKRYFEEKEDDVADLKIDAAAIDNIVDNARKEGRSFLFAHEGQDVMNIIGISVPKSLIATSIEGALQSAAMIGYPLVMKVVSKDILHKSDAGGIALDLDNEEEIISAYEAIMRNCRARVPRAVIEGVAVSEMVPNGTEMIVGARIDGSFGPTVMVGLGGIYVEVMKDVSFRAVPIGRQEIIAMIKEIRSYPLLLGVRGEKTRDINALVDTIIRIGSVIRYCKGISDIEINPLILYEQGLGARAVDVRIILSINER